MIWTGIQLGIGIAIGIWLVLNAKRILRFVFRIVDKALDVMAYGMLLPFVLPAFLLGLGAGVVHKVRHPASSFCLPELPHSDKDGNPVGWTWH